MKKANVHPGTTWHKCDFQCHTPRDLSWAGSPDLPGGDQAAELARQHWAEAFIAAATAANLQAVAISDHHDVCLSTYVLEAASRLNSKVRVFPAVEITCSDILSVLSFLIRLRLLKSKNWRWRRPARFSSRQVQTRRLARSCQREKPWPISLRLFRASSICAISA